ncbi:hypothetical protein Taro_044073 [Colocasia esculenta]|uniref:Uncharacterized protein n=1 Tax=Colocasia esculenta TaxID=4460 RepID=A0A843WXD1_COLES|nr:hypothetical protein [Colocasia esculenta]
MMVDEVMNTKSLMQEKLAAVDRQLIAVDRPAFLNSGITGTVCICRQPSFICRQIHTVQQDDVLSAAICRQKPNKHKYSLNSPLPALTRCWGLLDEERRPRSKGIRGEKAGPSFNPSSSSSNPRRSNESKILATLPLRPRLGLNMW